MESRRFVTVFALVILLGLSSWTPGCQTQELIPNPEFEFLDIVFTNVTELVLLYTMVGDFINGVDPVSGLTGIFAEIHHNPELYVTPQCLQDGNQLLVDVLYFKEYALQGKTYLYTWCMGEGDIEGH